MSSKISAIVEAVKSGESTARKQVEEALSRIEKASDYNAVISTIEHRSLARADEIDQKIADGKPVGVLAGVTFIAKDNFLTFDSETTAASNILRGFTAPYQATAIERLEAEGAICVAKANMDAFAHGSSTENSDFGATKNPVNTDYVPGGSSGGSAAVIALDIVPFALGTDTGGSIRLPASYCGVVGYKPTYGLVSRFGVIAMASSTDVIAPIARSAEDVAIVLDVMSGKDTRDGTTIERDQEHYSLQAASKNLRIGIIKEYMAEGLDAETRTAIESKVAELKSRGHTVEEVSIPSVDLALSVYYIVVPAEISSNLARYDGIKYGFSDDKARSLSEVYGLSRGGGFNDENKRRIMIGNYVLSSGYYDAYYRKAQTVRTVIINEFNKAFGDYDLLIGPTSPGPAFKLGENVSDPLQMYLVDIMTVAVSVAGLPAISVPAGTSHQLPVGLQIIGQLGDDRKILSLARELESSDI